MERKLLKFLGECKSLRELKQTHVQILVNGVQEHTSVLPKLISLSAGLCSVEYADKAFQASRNPNIIAYNTMIKCFTGTRYKSAVSFYNQMKKSNVMPNSFTLIFLLRCLGWFEDLKHIAAVHGESVKLGFCSCVFVQNTLLHLYSKCGWAFEFAHQVFDEMPERDVASWNTLIGAYMANGETESAVGLFETMPKRNIVTWNSVVSGLTKAGNMGLALSFFEQMPEKNEVSWNSMISGFARVGDMKSSYSIFCRMPEKTVVSWTALVPGYCSIGDLESAGRVFDQMPVKYAVSWNAMIAGYVHNHVFDQALGLFHRMLIDGKCKPNQTTLISILSACSHLGSLEHGKWVDSYIKRNKIDLSNPLGNALIDMFAKCGDVESAKAVFEGMGHNKCIITWTTMISGLAVNGQCQEAIDLFERMRVEGGAKPDDVIFISVLSACTHGGLVEEGKKVFDCMVKEYKIEPRVEHYGCMVDLLGRAGRLEEAVRFIGSMHLEPNAVIWATLLSCCKIHGKTELLEQVTRKILEQEPSNPGYLMLISNMSASIGQWEHYSSYRVSMRQNDVEKVPGCSSIQIGNQVHEFIVKDSRHERRSEIYNTLDVLRGHLKETCDWLLSSNSRLPGFLKTK